MMYHPIQSSVVYVASILLCISILSQTIHSFSSKAWTTTPPPRLINIKSATTTHQESRRFPKTRPSLLLAATSEDNIDKVVVDNKNTPELFLFNTKSRSKEPFQSINPKKVSMYTCGPTVYDYAHVGNFRAFLTYDLVKRVLLYFGYEVDHVCNLTDVDDKIINRANEQKLDNGKITDLTLKFENYFFDDLKALNVLLASRYPRATEHIPEMMDMILDLAEKDLAYETEDGSWYFATSNKEGYGEQLVQLNKDDMESQQTAENAIGTEMKKDARDFALWKAFKEDTDREDASWSHPDGKIQKGRPGWHLECSAMAKKYLGDTIDIHGGGCDLQFPHHENEIAQSEGVTGKTFCNCWVHNGFVNINDEKMSKSLGNFLTLRTACPKALDVRAYRFFVMSSQYQKQLGFTPQATDAAKSALKRIDGVMQQIDDAIKDDNADTTSDNQDSSSPLTDAVSKALTNFEAALLDDLSMPRASAALFSLIKAAEMEFKRVKKASKDNDNDTTTANLDLEGLKKVQTAMHKMDKVFGIFYEVPLTEKEKEEQEKERAAGSSGALGDSPAVVEISDEVMELVLERTNAKDAKDWELADSLRARITELGFAVKDVKGGDPIVTKIE
jgi:cysteinyl-tRNA synthetase